MKKLVSLVLSVLIVFGCISCAFSSIALADGSATVAGENLLADLSAEDFTHCDGWGTRVDEQILVGGTNHNAIGLTAATSGQFYYFKKSLTAGKEYNFSFTAHSTNVDNITHIRVFDEQYANSKVNGTTDGGNYLLNKEPTGNSIYNTEATYTYSLTPTTTVNYVFVIRLNATKDSAGSDKVYFYDFSLTETFNVACDADGNGTASVVANGANATFTATANEGEEFLGWYDGETLVDENATYTTAINANTTLIAKFTTYDLMDADLWGMDPQRTNLTFTVNGEQLVVGGTNEFAYHYATVNLKPNTTYKWKFAVNEGNTYDYYSIWPTSVGISEVRDNCQNPSGYDTAKRIATQNLFLNNFVANEGWHDVTITFTTNATDISYQLFLRQKEEAGAGTTYKNMHLEEVVNVSASAVGNGTASVSKNTCSVGEEVTFTATPKTAEEFLGWYDGETLVDENATYTTAINANTTLIAKFTTKNLLVDISKSDFSGVLQSGWLTNSITDTTVTDGEVTYPAVSLPTYSSGQTFAFEKELEAGYAYTYSFKAIGENVDDLWYVRVTSDGSNTIFNAMPPVAVSGTVAEGAAYSFTLRPTATATYEFIIAPNKYNEGATSGSVKVYDFSLVKGNAFYTVSATAEGRGTASVSKTVCDAGEEVTFTAAAESNDVTFDGWYDGEARVSTVLEYTLAINENTALVAKFVTNDIAEYANAGNAIRGFDSALRFKFKLSNEMLTSYNGMTTKKIGLLVIPTEFIGDKELILGGKYTENNYVPVEKEVLAENYQYKEGDTSNTYFTAALYNIDRNGTAYYEYATSYTVRPYIVYEDANGDEVVYYGDAVSASMVAVMNKILKEDSSEYDVGIVNNLLENSAIAEVYNSAYPAN